MIRLTPGLAAAIESLAHSLGEQTPPIILTQEHHAIHVNDLHEGVRYWKSNGYALLKQTDAVAFLMHRDPTKVIVELIKEPTVEHLAFTVTKVSHLDDVKRYIEGRSRPVASTNKPVFVIVEASLNGPDVKYLLILHPESRAHIQILWRLQTLESLRQTW